MIKNKKLSFVLVASVLAYGCSSTPEVDVEKFYETEIERVFDMTIRSLSAAVQNDLNTEGNRLTAIKEVGEKAGRAAGIKTRNQSINLDLQKYNRYLSTIFNFEQLIVAGTYLPPRIDIIRGEVKKEGGTTLRTVRQAYRIATEPTLVTQRPTHLNYLYRLNDDVEPINSISLPRRDNLEEIRTWKQAVKKGYVQGLRIADISYLEDINLLHRDFSGMLRYIELANKGMVAMPDISRTERGIIMSSDGKMLNVGDEVISIDSSPLFKSIQLWQPRMQSLEQK
jgi:defect-in-organelle-trafficking protein DotC